jgi:Asp-tRNA(Asn)/Glu-tRNA(Gln) amidotransferase C subunit
MSEHVSKMKAKIRNDTQKFCENKNKLQKLFRENQDPEVDVGRPEP